MAAEYKRTEQYNISFWGYKCDPLANICKEQKNAESFSTYDSIHDPMPFSKNFLLTDNTKVTLYLRRGHDFTEEGQSKFDRMRNEDQDRAFKDNRITLVSYQLDESDSLAQAKQFIATNTAEYDNPDQCQYVLLASGDSKGEQPAEIKKTEKIIPTIRNGGYRLDTTSLEVPHVFIRTPTNSSSSRSFSCDFDSLRQAITSRVHILRQRDLQNEREWKERQIEANRFSSIVGRNIENCAGNLRKLWRDHPYSAHFGYWAWFGKCGYWCCSAR